METYSDWACRRDDLRYGPWEIMIFCWTILIFCWRIMFSVEQSWFSVEECWFCDSKQVFLRVRWALCSPRRVLLLRKLRESWTWLRVSCWANPCRRRHDGWSWRKWRRFTRGRACMTRLKSWYKSWFSVEMFGFCIEMFGFCSKHVRFCTENVGLYRTSSLQSSRSVCWWRCTSRSWRVARCSLG